MIIKTADGDRSIIFAHWANMKKGRAGESNVRHAHYALGEHIKGQSRLMQLLSFKSSLGKNSIK